MSGQMCYEAVNEKPEPGRILEDTWIVLCALTYLKHVMNQYFRYVIFPRWAFPALYPHHMRCFVVRFFILLLNGKKKKKFKYNNVCCSVLLHVSVPSCTLKPAPSTSLVWPNFSCKDPVWRHMESLWEHGVLSYTEAIHSPLEAMLLCDRTAMSATQIRYTASRATF